MLTSRRILVAAVVLAVLSATAALAPRAGSRPGALLALGAGAQAASSGGTAPLVVTVSTTRSRGAVRPDSIGLSVETADLAVPGLTRARGIARLLRALGPSLLRVGGSSVDRPPATVTPLSTLRGLEAVLLASGWSVQLTEDLGHYSAHVVQADARRSEAVLGPRLAGVACGNETGGFVGQGFRPRGWGVRQLVADDRACLLAVHAAVPRVPLVGPDTVRTDFLAPWTAALAGTASVETSHYYPMADCRVSWLLAPSLLGPDAQDEEAAALAPAVASAVAHGMSFRVDETNSAACRGIPGLSDAYASALWGADDVFTVLGTGAVGLDFHGFVTAAGCLSYSPICLPAGARTVRAQPLYDGLLLAHAVGCGPLLGVTSPSPTLRVHAVARTDGRTGVLLENESAEPRVVVLQLPGGRAPVSTTTMLDPGGLSALGGVALRHGRLEPAAAGAGPTPGARTGPAYRVVLPPWSGEVLVTSPQVGRGAGAGGPGDQLRRS